MDKKKIFSGFLAFLYIFIIALPVSYANEEALDFDNALRIAISSNDDLRKLDNEYKALWNQRNSISDGVPDDMKSSPVYISQIVQGSQQLEAQARNKKRQQEVTLEAIEFNLKRIFFQIKIHEENMALKSNEIEKIHSDLEMQMLKRNYGVSSEYEVKQLQHNLESAKRDRDTSSKEVQKQYFALNKLLGQSTVKYSSIVPKELDYKVIGKNEAEQRIGAALANSAAISEARLAIDMLHLQKELYPLNSQANAIMGGQNNLDKPEKISDQISIVSDTLNIQTKELSQQIRTMQNSLQTIELEITALETQLKNLDEHIRIANLQLQAGLVAPKQVEDVLMQQKRLENGIYNLKSQHTLLRLQFEKPYLMGA